MYTYSNLGSQKVGRLIFFLSVPPMLLMLIHEALEVADTMILSKLGAEALAAVTLCAPAQLLLFAIAGATGVGVNSLMSRSLGENKLEACGNIAWHALFIGIVYSLLFTWLGRRYLEELLLLAGAQNETLELCRIYLEIYLWGVPFILIPHLTSNLILGEGNTLLPMAGYVISAVANVLMDICLIWGLWIFPELGFEGAAWASVIGRAAGAVFFLKILTRKGSVIRWRLSDFSWNRRIFREIYRVGLPVLFIELFMVGLMLIMNRTLMQFGFMAVAVLGIFQHTRALFMIPVSCLAQGVMPIAGYAFGAKNFDRVKEVLVKGTVLAMAFLMAGWAGMQFYGAEIMGFFTSDPLQIEHGMMGFRLATIVFPLLGPLIIFSTILQAMGKGMQAMIFSLLRQGGIFLPALILLPQYFGLSGVWLAYSVSELLSVLMMLLFLRAFWRSLSKRRKVRAGFYGGYWAKRLWSWLKW